MNSIALSNSNTNSVGSSSNSTTGVGLELDILSDDGFEFPPIEGFPPDVGNPIDLR